MLMHRMASGSSLGVVRCFAAMAAAVLCCARTPLALAGSAMRAAGGAPAGADVVLVVENARGWRDSVVGRGITEVLSRSGAMHEIDSAWAEVSKGLGMDPKEAFDKLAGERIVFIGRWTDTDGFVWAVRTLVDERTERRVRETLAGSPRAVAGGRPVLMVEGGSFEMVVAREGRQASVIMAPTEDASMLRSMVRAMEGRNEVERFNTTPVFRRLDNAFARPAELVLFVRSPDARSDWFGIAARRDGERTEFGMALESGDGAQGNFADLPIWSKSAFELLARDSIAVVFDMNLRVPGEGGRSPQRLLTLGFSAEGQSALGDRVAMLLRPGRHGPIEVAFAFETNDAVLTAREGDEVLDRMMRQMRPGVQVVDAAAEQPPRRARFAGAPPTAIRTVDLREEIGPELVGLWKIGPRLTWRTRITDEQCNPGQQKGWWTVGLGGRATEDLGRVLSDADCTEEAGLPWVSLGLVRPRALFESARATGLPIPPIFGDLERIEHVRWQAARMSSTTVIGTGEIVVREHPRK